MKWWLWLARQQSLQSNWQRIASHRAGAVTSEPRLDAQLYFGKIQALAKNLMIKARSHWFAGSVCTRRCQNIFNVRYGVISLGDFGSYPNTFAGGGKRFDERLEGLGAKRIGDVFTHDASGGTMPETDGAAWARQWLVSALSPV